MFASKSAKFRGRWFDLLFRYQLRALAALAILPAAFAGGGFFLFRRRRIIHPCPVARLMRFCCPSSGKAVVLQWYWCSALQGWHRATKGFSVVTGIGEIHHVRVTPKASSNRIDVALQPDGSQLIRVFVTAPPDRGKANKATIELLAKHFGLPKTSIVLVRGQTSRNKIFRIAR